MCSLPQGWHGLPSPRNSLSNNTSDFISAVPKFRWNSTQMTQKQCNSPIRKSSLSALPNFQSKIPPVRTPANIRRNSAVKSEVPTLCKEHDAQITNLKKEILALKAENTVLKAKVRKQNDENVLMVRQIVKYKADAQKESSSQKTAKEEPLRLKIVKLESTLKEKDFAVKNMLSEMNALHIDELKDIFDKYKKEFGIKNGIGSGLFQRHKLLQPVRQVLPSKPTRPAVTDQSSSQVEKLRTLLYKREAESQLLEKNSKEKDCTIRRLKVQISQLESSLRNSSSIKQAISRSSVSRAGSDRSSTHLNEVEEKKKPAGSSKSSAMKSQLSSVPKINRTSSAGSSFAYRRRSNPPPKNVRSQKDIEKQAQALRENIAARKIQQGWRHHRAMKNMEGLSDADKAFFWIYSELNTHKHRKDKLNRTHPDKCKLPMKEEEQFAKDVQLEFLNLIHSPPLHPALCK